ncbi:MAG: 4'-phosphopantetheinyl transferase superfamily protein [Clostridia bacterium]|nr:4'-phosphopantetheinyl transferase superfamily protein [Clostridia bacterium]
MKLYYTLYPYEKKNRQREKTARDKLLRHVLAVNGIDFDKAEFEKNEHGKPYIVGSDLKFNISHSKGIVVMAVSSDEIGADCEKIRPYPKAVVNRVFIEEEKTRLENSSDKDLTFFEMWTCKEAFVKLVGQGIGYSLERVNSFDDTFDYDGKLYRKYIYKTEDFFVTVICSDEEENSPVKINFDEV